MYSLTQATQLFLQHSAQNNTVLNDAITSYNMHKIRHSLGVLETGRNLLILMQEHQTIDEKTIKKAEIVFLLHDLGRFYQNDGVKILKNTEFEHGDVSYQLCTEAGYPEDICLPIKYHNKYDINNLYTEPSFLGFSSHQQEEIVFLTKLIRDADKLQNMIYSIFNINHFLKIDVYGQGLTRDDIYHTNQQDIINKKQIERKNIFSFGDYLLSSLCWVFDINFSESITMLRNYGYFEKMMEKIKELPEISPYSLEIIQKNIIEYKK